MEWMEKCYSRLLIDNHITDLLPEFMSRFDPRNYVEMVKLAGVEASMVYACDHNGNCYYPTCSGHPHGNLNGRDLFGETVELLRKERIVPIAYYTIIYHNWSAKNHESWRMRDCEGNTHGGRYHYSCPNNAEYGAFCRKQLEEVTAYPVAGLFIDMTFWPMVCFCDSCRAAWRKESGREIPTVIDWQNPEWVAFQRWRERSMAEFGQMLTDHVKRLHPEMSVTHQFSPVLHGWFLGQSSGTADASDYASGDFYGGKAQQRIGAKIFSAYSKHQPFEFMTSRCVDLHDHTSTKSDDELFLHAVTTLANGGAYFFIDAIHPDGTLNRDFYQRLHKTVRRLEPFKEMVKKHVPVLSARTALYFSMTGCVNESLNGVPISKMSEGGGNMDNRKNALVDEVTAAGAILSKLHIPYRVVTDRTSDFSEFKTMIVCAAAYLSDAECERLRSFVENGGTLIATGKTSLYDPEGRCTGDFRLADVFGISWSGKMTDAVSYLDPGRGRDLISVRGPCSPLVKATTAEVRGTVVLPHFPCDDPERYASIHSNPPGIPTEYAGLTINRCGKGRCIYLYSPLLMHRQYSQEQFGMELFAEFAPEFVTASEHLPGSTELTLLKSSKENAYLLGIVNYQEELPNIPLHEVSISIRLPEGFIPEQLVRASDGTDLEFTFRNGILSIQLHTLQNAEILELREKKK